MQKTLTRKYVSTTSSISSSSSIKMPVAKFGSILGEYKGVKAYSSDYDSADDTKFPSRQSYISFAGAEPGADHGPHYCGYKYQCVEYSRRFLIQAHQITYGDIGMAHSIFNQIYRTGFHKIVGIDHDKGEVQTRRIAAVRCLNGKQPETEEGKRLKLTRPPKDSLLIWEEGGFFRHTGHVAVVTETVDYGNGQGGCRVIEQNVTDKHHPGGKEYARELPVTFHEDGTCHIAENYRNSHVMGWIAPAEIIPELVELQKQQKTKAAADGVLEQFS